MAYLIGLFAMTSAVCLVVGIYWLRQRSALIVKLGDYSQITGQKVKPSYFEIRIRPLSKKLALRFPQFQKWITPSDIEPKLAYAGAPLGLDTDQFFGLQLVACLGFAVVGFLVGAYIGRFVGMFFGAVILAGVGLYYPILWLNGRVRRRQQEITIAVPDSIDLLATSIEAGLGFDQALEHVVERSTGPLADEYGRFLNALQMGVPREESFRRLMVRNSSEELRTIVGALLQAYQLGAPISQTLQSQADEMRTRRVQRAKELGAQASPKITLVTTILIAPSVMCLFIAIVALKLADNLGPFLQEFTGP